MAAQYFLRRTFAGQTLLTTPPLSGKSRGLHSPAESHPENHPRVELEYNGGDYALKSFSLQTVAADSTIEINRRSGRTWLVRVREPNGQAHDIRFSSDSKISASITPD